MTLEELITVYYNNLDHEAIAKRKELFAEGVTIEKLGASSLRDSYVLGNQHQFQDLITELYKMIRNPYSPPNKG